MSADDILVVGSIGGNDLKSIVFIVFNDLAARQHPSKVSKGKQFAIIASGKFGNDPQRHRVTALDCL